MRLRTVVFWLVIAFIVWWIIKDPAAAGQAARNLGHGISVVFTSIASFLSALLGGHIAPSGG